VYGPRLQSQAVNPDLRFQLLGPVRAWRDGAEVNLGARKQRAVLAAMLLRVPQPVSADEIARFVWGTSAPPAAMAAVHTYVCGLRSALDPGRPSRSRDGVVTSSSTGYRLRIDPEQADFLKFQRLVRGGGVDRLNEALGLWAGRPLVDLGEPCALHPVVSELEQQWLAAAVLTADAAFCEGRVEDTIPWLVQGSARAPLHEPLQARLIESYRRVGRRADALATFHRVRRGLRDELGIGPGAELSDAFQRALVE
jgi:DNA-binding SARP family transcriptional activator